MNRLASLSARWWWAVLGTWAVLVVGLHFGAPPFSKVAVYDFSQFLGHSSHSVQGGTLLANGWKDGSFQIAPHLQVRRRALQKSVGRRLHRRRIQDRIALELRQGAANLHRVGRP